MPEPASRSTLLSALEPLFPPQGVAHRLGLSRRRGGPSHSTGVTLAFAAIPSTSRLRALLPCPLARAERRVLLKPRTTKLGWTLRSAQALSSTVPDRVLNALAQRAELWMAEPSALLQALAGLTAGARIGVIVNPSAPERPAFHVFDAHSTLIAVAKSGRAGEAATVRREHDVLIELSASERLRGTVPVSLGLVETNTGAALVTSAFVGKPAPISLTPGLRTWLERCRSDRLVAFGETKLVRTTVDRLHASQDAVLVRAAQRALELAAATPVAETVTHGDFVPWNILMTRDGPRIFDWEFADLSGVPEWDALYFESQVQLIKRGGGSAELQALHRRSARQATDPEVALATSLLVLAQLALVPRGPTDLDRIAALRAAIRALAETH